MNLDIRLPIGMLFFILGSLLTIYGFLSDKTIYTRSLGINVNVWWGLVLVVFGSLMTLAALRHERKPASRSE